MGKERNITKGPPHAIRFSSIPLDFIHFFTISLVPDSFGILPSSQMFQMKRNGNGNGGTWQKTWNSALPRNQPTRRFLEILSRFFVIFHNLNFQSFKKVLKCYSIWFNLVLKCSSYFPQQSSFKKIWFTQID